MNYSGSRFNCRQLEMSDCSLLPAKGAARLETGTALTAKFVEAVNRKKQGGTTYLFHLQGRRF